MDQFVQNCLLTLNNDILCFWLNTCILTACNCRRTSPCELGGSCYVVVKQCIAGKGCVPGWGRRFRSADGIVFAGCHAFWQLLDCLAAESLLKSRCCCSLCKLCGEKKTFCRTNGTFYIYFSWIVNVECYIWPWTNVGSDRFGNPWAVIFRCPNSVLCTKYIQFLNAIIYFFCS